MGEKQRLLLVCGSDDYLVAEKAKAVIDEWVPAADRDFGLEIIDGNVDTSDRVVAAVGQCLEALQTMSFFGGGKTVWLRNASFLAGGGRSFDSDRVIESIVSLTSMVREGVAEGQAFLLSTCAIPRNSALFKAFKEADAVVDFGADGKPWERERALRENFGTFLERFGLKMGTQVRDEFLARVGSDTRTILQELEKLLLYRGGPGEIKTADVEAITSVGKEAEAWDLTDAVGLRNSVKVALSLRRLEEQGTAPIMLSVMLDGRIRDLILIRAGLDGGWLRAYDKSASWDNPPREAQLAFGLAESLSKQTSYRLAKLAQQARNYTLNELRAARHHLMMMREQMVSGSLDEGFLMETTLFKIVGRPAPRGSSRG